jgi:hypothetical protein
VQRRAFRRPWIRHGRVGHETRGPCRRCPDYPRACVRGRRPQVLAASPGHPRVALPRLLRPQPLCPAGRAARWRARSLLNHDLHPITLMWTREHPLRGLELQAVAIGRMEFQRALALIDALNGRHSTVPCWYTRQGHGGWLHLGAGCPGGLLGRGPGGHAHRRHASQPGQGQAHCGSECG